MKESIANSMLLTIIVVFIGLVSFVFLSSLNYSKAFKIKNKIIDIIEKYDTGYAGNEEAVQSEVEEALSQIGYRVNSGREGCPTRKGATNNGQALNDTQNYRYCIYRENNTRGSMYYVIAYMYFDIPIINNLLEFEVTGQTKVFYQIIDGNNG